VGDPEIPSSPNLFNALLESILKNQEKTHEGFSQFQVWFAPYFKQVVLNMASIDPIRLEDLPPSISDRYSNPKRDQFLVTVFPANSVWTDARFLDRFSDDLERISENATGMPPIFRALIEIIGQDGSKAALLTLLVVFLLLWIDFRKPGHALMAMIPLAFGMIWMLGLMKLTGMQLTVMNVMGLPMILGIGIDDGVHLVHRWRTEGPGKIDLVFATTGKAILLTSLTTMLGFGSLVFSIWRGFGHLGGALFLGVGACFLTTVLFLSGIIGFIERKPKKKK
jgi:predicted RND superfamily exporter protein